MTDQSIPLVEKLFEDLAALTTQFLSSSEKNQLQIIPQFINFGEPGCSFLREYLATCQKEQKINLVVGKIYQELYQSKTPENLIFLETYFPEGIVTLKSERNINYQPLQKLLLERQWQSADQVTREKLCELAGTAAMQRKWPYFTEVEKFPITDLITINQLWLIYSEGKFGFSVQRQLWLSVGKDFTKLWPLIGWKNGNKWTRYPNEFIWDLKAPIGHMPLINQLRGVRVIEAIFSHPAWSKF